MITVISALFGASTRAVFSSANIATWRPETNRAYRRNTSLQTPEYSPSTLEILVFDVAARHVIRQQHDFVGEQILVVFLRQLVAFDAPQNVDDEVSGSGARVENFHARRLQADLPNSLCNTALDAGAHPIHDFLRRVNDAHRVGGFGRIALKKPLVNRC